MSILGDAIARRVFADVPVFPREIAALIGAYAEHRVVRFARAANGSSGDGVSFDGRGDERATFYSESCSVSVFSTDTLPGLPRRWALQLTRCKWYESYFGVGQASPIDWWHPTASLVDFHGNVYVGGKYRSEIGSRWLDGPYSVLEKAGSVLEFELDLSKSELLVWHRGHPARLVALPFGALGPVSALHWVVCVRGSGNEVKLVEPQDEPTEPVLTG